MTTGRLFVDGKLVGHVSGVRFDPAPPEKDKLPTYATSLCCRLARLSWRRRRKVLDLVPFAMVFVPRADGDVHLMYPGRRRHGVKLVLNARSPA